MGNNASRAKYFKEKSIDPYIILQVSRNCTKRDAKKAYKLKAKTFHPDKGGSDLEFKILRECYEFVVETLESSGDKSHKDLSEEFLVKKDPVNYEKHFKSTNFESNDERLGLFVNNDLDFDNSEKFVSSKNSGPTDYSKVETPSYKNVFKNSKFNIKNFNAMFELHSDKKKEGKVEPEALISGSIEPFEIQVYNGLMTEKRNINNFRIESSSSEKYNVPVEECDIKKILAKQKREIKGLSKKKFKENFEKKKNEKAEIDLTRTYQENVDFLHDLKLERMKKELDDSEIGIKSVLRIFPKNTVEDYNQNKLESSSKYSRDFFTTAFVSKKIKN